MIKFQKIVFIIHRQSTENIEKFMGNMGFSKQKSWENYGSFMGFTVKNMGEIVVNLS